MKAQPVKSPYKDDITNELEKQIAIEFGNYIEQNRDMSFDELMDSFYSNVIEDYNNTNDNLVGFSIKELTDSAYEVDVWYW